MYNALALFSVFRIILIAVSIFFLFQGKRNNLKSKNLAGKIEEGMFCGF